MITLAQLHQATSTIWSSSRSPMSPCASTAAIITYKSHINVVVAGLGRFTHDAWHTYLYERRQGTWQVVWEQASAIGGFPPP